MSTRFWPLQRANRDFFFQPYQPSVPGRSYDGNAFHVAGRRVAAATGYGSHAPGHVDLDLEGSDARMLRGRVGIDDEWSRDKGSTVLRVVDLETKRELWRSPVVANGDKPLSFRVPLAGAKHVRLAWDVGPTGMAGSHVDLLDVGVDYAAARSPRPLFQAPASLGFDGPRPKGLSWPMAQFKHGEPVRQFALASTQHTPVSPSFPLVPTFPPQDGLDTQRPLSLYVVQANGAHSCELVLDRSERRDLPNGDRVETVFLKDPDYPVEVEQRATFFAGLPLVRVERAVRNRGAEPVTLALRDAAFVSLPAGRPVLRSFHGKWGAEKTGFDETPLPFGEHELSSTGISHNSQGPYPGFFLGYDGPIEEDRGRVAGVWLGRDGNWSLRAMRLEGDAVAVAGGSFPEPRKLGPGEAFETPFLLVAWSERGLGPATRAFQAWCRTRGGVMNPDAVRRVVLNSWEGVFFTFDEAKLLELVRGAATLGAELFVLDDGWFGNGAYARDDDLRGLGDWQINRRKLPHGLAPIVAECRRLGIDFGLWFEPEMVNKTSRLYREHPDWVLATPGRPLRPGRGNDQLMLDLSNPEVEEFVYHAVADVLAAEPGISYVKWDHNMRAKNQGAARLGADQGSLSDRYDEAFRRIAARLRRDFPAVAFQLCASGGGRADAASMQSFEEFWGSDETRALPRLPIQYGALHFHPPCALASHIAKGGAWGFKMRVDVAMCGRLGIELDPSEYSDADRATIRRGVEAYKALRPVLHAAEVFRGRNPHVSKTHEYTYVLPNKREAVLLAFDTHATAHAERVRAAGLAPRRLYEYEEANPDGAPRLRSGRATGRELMEKGLRIAFPFGPSSAVVRLRAVR